MHVPTRLLLLPPQSLLHLGTHKPGDSRSTLFSHVPDNEYFRRAYLMKESGAFSHDRIRDALNRAQGRPRWRIEPQPCMGQALPPGV
jgi:hypothetical protein